MLKRTAVIVFKSCYTYTKLLTEQFPCGTFSDTGVTVYVHSARCKLSDKLLIKNVATYLKKSSSTFSLALSFLRLSVKYSSASNLEYISVSFLIFLFQYLEKIFLIIFISIDGLHVLPSKSMPVRLTKSLFEGFVSTWYK